MVLWDEMKLWVLHQFCVGNTSSLHEQWLVLSQDDSIHDYQHNFIEFAAPLSNIFDEMAMRSFISGLKAEIRVELKLLEPNTLGRAMDLDQKLEDKLALTHTNCGALRIQRPSCWLASSPTKNLDPPSAQIQF